MTSQNKVLLWLWLNLPQRKGQLSQFTNFIFQVECILLSQIERRSRPINVDINPVMVKKNNLNQSIINMRVPNTPSNRSADRGTNLMLMLTLFSKYQDYSEI